MEVPGIAERKFEKPRKNKPQKRIIPKAGKFLNLTKKSNEDIKYVDLLNTLKILPDISTNTAETLATEIRDISDFIYLNTKLLGIVIYYLLRFDYIKTIDDLNPENFNDQLIFNYFELVNISINEEKYEDRDNKKADFLRYIIIVLTYRQK